MDHAGFERREGHNDGEAKDDDGDADADPFERANLAEEFFAFGALGFLEGGKLALDGFGVSAFLAQAERQPFARGRAEGFGKFCFCFGGRGGESGVFFPEGSSFEGPETEETVILRDTAQTRPEERAKGVGEGKIGDDFGMDATGAGVDLHGDGPVNFSQGVLDDLKFGEVFLEVGRGHLGGVP